jgi:nucleoside-diphosphate-sugar epimerase
MKKICITGVSGFLGSHMALYGLQKGYHIVGTVRSEEKAAETRSMLSKYLDESSLEKLEFRYADLLVKDGWDEAVRDCDAVMHVASPFILEIPKHEDELILPARNGVKHVFEAALKNNVNRIIQTSSIVAIVYGNDKKKTDFNEADWTNPESKMASPYSKSKTLAERDVWNYAKSNPQLNVTTINPGFVLGPILGKDPGTSATVILRMIKGEYPGVPKLGFPTIDVRDVVELHYLSLENPKSVGQRYAAVSSSVWFKDLARFVLEADAQNTKKVKTFEMPNWFVRLYAIFEKSAKMILPELGFMANISNEKAKTELGFKPRSVKEAVAATVESCITNKLV